MIGPDLAKEGYNLVDFENKVWASFFCCQHRLFHAATYIVMKWVFAKPAGSAWKLACAAKRKLVSVSQRDVFSLLNSFFLHGFKCVYISLSKYWFYIIAGFPISGSYMLFILLTCGQQYHQASFYEHSLAELFWQVIFPLGDFSSFWLCS